MLLDRRVGWLAASLAAGAGAAAGPAAAATDTDQLVVTATVASGCALSGGSLNFGEYITGQAQDLDAVGQINYTNCIGNVSFELDGGQSASIANRQMSSGASRLRYQLYRNSSRTAVWGTGTDAQGLTLLIPQNGRVDVFGRVLRGQGVAAGAYSDVVTITMTF